MSEAAPATDRFEALFRAHHAAVVAYARRRIPASVVDDVVGETFLVAWRRLDRIPAHELPWLLSVARNVLATQRRGSARRQALLLKLRRTPGPPTGSADQPLAAPALDERLAAALAALSAKEREALTLIAWDGLAPHEAAVVLGDSPGAFRVRLHRARRRLLGLLEEGAERPQPTGEYRLRLEEAAHD